ncbi:MAG: response regulator [Verrucomicrobiota bacterium]
MGTNGNGERRILVADDVDDLREAVCGALSQRGYLVEGVSDGEQCLVAIGLFRPHLLLLDVMMPHIHGIDVLQRIRREPMTRDLGVVFCTAKKFAADMSRIESLGAFDIISKPFEVSDLVGIVERYFEGAPSCLNDEWSDDKGEAIPGSVYLPRLPVDCPTIRMWGTRGSSPVVDPQHQRHGGNTSCLELRYRGTRLIFDAGTGIRDLGNAILEEGPEPIHVFITHTHWDHVQGFPFFSPAYHEDREVHIYGAKGFGQDLEALFRGQLQHDYFPVELDDMKAELHFHHLSGDAVEIGGIRVTWEAANHPGATVGYRMDVGDVSVAFFPDNEFLRGYLGPPDRDAVGAEEITPYQSYIDFLAGVDVLIHEAQYTNEEYPEKIGWGHSALSNMCLLTKLAGVKSWIITHHDPDHDDVFLQHKLNLTRHILSEIGNPIPVDHAFDGMEHFIIPSGGCPRG